MCHDVATFGNDTTTAGTSLTVTHHGIVTLGGIVNPRIEVAQHTGINGTEEVEEVLREIEVSCVALNLVPVDEVLRHPYLLALLGKVFICRLNTAVLMTAIDVKTVDNISLVQCIGIAVIDGKSLRSHDFATDGAPVGLHELCYLRCIP